LAGAVGGVGTFEPLARSRTPAEPIRSRTMWKKPKIVEIAVGLEINAYACAELD
jgi:coenzyme PQQ precursor peptide PqqA